MTVQTGPWQGGEGQGLGPSPGLAPAALCLTRPEGLGSVESQGLCAKEDGPCQVAPLPVGEDKPWLQAYRFTLQVQVLFAQGLCQQKSESEPLQVSTRAHPRPCRVFCISCIGRWILNHCTV